MGQTRRFHDVRCMSGWRVIPEMRVSIAGIALAIIQAFGQEANSCDMNSAGENDSRPTLRYPGSANRQERISCQISTFGNAPRLQVRPSISSAFEFLARSVRSRAFNPSQSLK